MIIITILALGLAVSLVTNWKSKKSYRSLLRDSLRNISELQGIITMLEKEVYSAKTQKN